MTITHGNTSRLSTLANSADNTKPTTANSPSPGRVTPGPLPPEPEPEPPRPRAPSTPRSVFGEYALYGLAGKIVRALAPHTEAPAEGLLLQLLAAFSNIIGPGPLCMVGATRHSLNLFIILVGDSSKARKGTSWNQIAQLFAAVDPAWIANRVTSERVTVRTLTSILGHPEDGDRRLLVLAEELSSMLHAMGRSHSQLSPLLRSAWDNGTLRLFNRISNNDPASPVNRGHLSLIGHITRRELDASLHRNDSHNGFANRCLWGCVQRIRCLPDGGNLPAEVLSALARDLTRRIEWAQSEKEIVLHRDAQAAELWNDYYPTLSQATPDMHGAATARAEAQVLRISALYAILDGSPLIRLPHLQAAPRRMGLLFLLRDFPLRHLRRRLHHRPHPRSSGILGPRPLAGTDSDPLSRPRQ